MQSAITDLFIRCLGYDIVIKVNDAICCPCMKNCGYCCRFLNVLGTESDGN